MKYVWIGGGVIMLLVLAVLVIGYTLPVKHTATGEASFKATPETLFALITNVEAFPTWRSDLKSADRVASTDGKQRFREVSSDGTIIYVLESVEPGRRMVTRIDDKTLPFGGTWTYELTPGPGGRTSLRITEDGEVYNPVFRFVSRFMMGHDSTIRKYLAAVGRQVPG